jgi:hypothetical protein
VSVNLPQPSVLSIRSALARISHRAFGFEPISAAAGGLPA